MAGKPNLESEKISGPQKVMLLMIVGIFAERRKAFGIDPRRAAVARRMGPYRDLLAKSAVKAEAALEAGDLSFQIGQPVFGSNNAGLVHVWRLIPPKLLSAGVDLEVRTPLVGSQPWRPPSCRF